MPTNPGVSEVQDKNGVVADIEAKRFDGTRTVEIQGDVTALQTWNGDSNTALTLNASIGAKKVTQDKIGDKAVGSGQMGDGSVGLTQMDPNAMNGTVQDNDSKLATHAAVKTYVDSQISGQGTYLGKHTVAEINAFVTDNLHNGDRVMVSDSGTINLGPGGVGFDVIAGEDLILYKSGSTVQWDTMDGNFKTKQNAVSKAGSTTKTVTAFSQNANGDADVTYEEIQRASTSHEGLVQLTDSHDSTSTTTAATPNSVKSAYDLANTANTGLANKLDKTGDGKDVTVSFSDASQRTNIGTGEKLSVMFGKIKKWFTDLKALAFKDTVADSDISGTISDNHIASASTWNGKADKVSGATNGNLAALDSNGNLTDSGKKASDFELVTNKVSAWHGTPDNTHYPSEKLVKDSLDAKADVSKIVGVADATYTRENENGPGWNKLASIENFGTWRNNIGMFDLYFATLGSITNKATLLVNVRWDSDRTNASIVDATIVWDVYDSAYKVAVVNRASSTSVITEIWAYLPKGNYSMALSYRSGSTKTGSSTSHAATFTDNKDNWSFFSYLATSVEKPTEDLTNFVKVKDADGIILQKNIANPTNNNLVAMDANGLVKDSGIGSGTLSTALAKLNGIEAGAEANVQSDWNEADSSSDAFIKNKPFYHTSVTSNTIKKVCTVTKRDSAGSVEAIGIDFIARRYAGAIRGRLTYKTGWSIYLEKCGDVSLTNSSVSIYHAADGNDPTKIVIYASISGYVDFCCAPAINYPKSYVNFDSFGTTVSFLPEGATEITPVWVANSASSSGTAPVKVDEYGALTPVPMDSTPTESSTNLMTSGDIKTALDAKEKAVMDALNGKTDLIAVRLTNSDDLNSIANTYSAGTLQVYNWLSTSVPANAPDTLPCTMVQYGIANTSTSKNCVQVVYPRSADFYFERICNSGTWSAWKKVFYAATSTYSSTGTQAVNGTAVASAISTKQDTLSFMTTAEAVAIWNDAKTAAANAS